MKQPTDKRQRTLALQNRALSFSNGVNQSCPRTFSSLPSSTVWSQLVRAADSVSNNLIEADDASSDADFLHRMRITLREAKESRLALAKIRLGPLDNHQLTRERKLEDEAGELAAIFAAIIHNMTARLALEKSVAERKRTKS